MSREKAIAFVVDLRRGNNRILEPEYSGPTMYTRLKQRFEELGYQFNTQDITAVSSSAAALYLNVPRRRPEHDFAYLLFLESPLIRPENYRKHQHQPFRRVFTNAERFMNDANYQKVNYSYRLPVDVPRDTSRKRKLATMVVGNKNLIHKDELYSERLRAIRWFERNAPDSFEFYGRGWDRMKFPANRILRRLNRFDALGKRLAPKYSTFRGEALWKLETLSEFWFSIAYENAKGYDGYITEKIFHSMFAGTVPVYLGAPDVAQHIPDNCFVDFRRFSSYREMFSTLTDMGQEEYLRSLEAIDNFLHSKRGEPFSVEYFARTIADTIVADLEG